MCALNQTWPTIEVVVVDDASQDSTPDLIKHLQRSDDRIRLFEHQVNQGVAATRNTILREAQGAFIAFFDDDDLSAPDRVSLQIERIKQYEHDFAGGAPVVCHTARRLCFLDGSEQVARTMGEDASCEAPHGLAVVKRTLMGVPSKGTDGGCATCSQMARTAVYQAVGGFDPSFRRSEDTDFVVRLAMAGGHFAGIAKPLVEQRMTPTSDKTLAIEKEATKHLLAKHKAFLDSQGEYAFSCQWNDMKYSWLEHRFLGSTSMAGWLLMTHPRKVVRRLTNAMPQVGLNQAYRRFQSEAEH